jgi:tetratricopeptide (TPR) repeat protein/O-antigen ligase
VGSQRITGAWFRRGILLGLQALIVLVPLVFSSVFNEYGTPKMVLAQVIGVGMAVCWLSSMVVDGEVSLIDTPLNYTFMAFLAVQFISLFLAYNAHEGIETLFGYLSFFLIASLIFYIVQDAEEMHRLCILMVWTATVVALIGLLQHNGIYHFGAPWNLPISTIGNVNFTAQYYNVVFPIALALLFMPHRFWVQVSIGAGVFLMACHLVVLGSRGGWLGALVATATLIIAALSRHDQVGRRLLDTTVMAVVLVGLGWPVVTGMMSGIQVGEGRNLGQLMDSYQTRVLQRVESAILLEDDSTLQRVNLWQDTARMIWDKPLLGVGMGNFAYNVPLHMSRESLQIKKRREQQTGQDLMPFSAHNEYLEIWAETGILGIAVFSFLLYQLLGAVYLLVVRFIRGEEPLLAVGLAAAVLATLAHSFFSTNLQQPVSAVHFWIVVGMIWSLKLNVEGRPSIALLETGGRRFAQSLLLTSAVILMVVLVMGVRTLIGEYDYQLGKRYFKFKEYPDAERAWDRASHYEPTKYFQTLQALATARYNQENWPGAIAAFESSLRYHPNNAQVHHLLGRAIVKTGKLSEALVHQETAVKLGPFNASYQVALGESLLQTGAVDAAVTALNESLRLDPNQPEAHQLLGACFKQKGDLPGALAAYQKALSLDGKNKEVRNSLAVIYTMQDELEEAERILVELVREWPGNLDYRLNLGVVQLQREQNASAVQTLESIIETDPRYVRAYRVLGQAYTNQNLWREARGVYARALVEWPADAVFRNALNQLP